MIRKTLVYLAGPITNGGKTENTLAIADNLFEADDVAYRLMRAGYAVINPAVTGYPLLRIKEDVERGLRHNPAIECGWDEWLSNDEGILNRVDVVLRLPGASSGADREVAYAEAHKIPVMFSLKELKNKVWTAFEDEIRFGFLIHPNHNQFIDKLADTIKKENDLPDDQRNWAIYPKEKPTEFIFKKYKTTRVDQTVSVPQMKNGGSVEVHQSGAKKDSQEGRGDFSLIPYDGQLQLAEHLRLGGLKYGANNWRAGIPFSRIVSAIRRHAAQLGQLNDENHLAAILAEASFLAEFVQRAKAGDPAMEKLDDTWAPLKEMPWYGKMDGDHKYVTGKATEPIPTGCPVENMSGIDYVRADWEAYEESLGGSGYPACFVKAIDRQRDEQARAAKA